MNLMIFPPLKPFIKSLIAIMMRLWSHIYTYRCSEWFETKRNRLYTRWIRNFIGEVGEESSFCYPLRLQGGGSKRIRIGARTGFQAFCVLGCWERYGCQNSDGSKKTELFEPEIIIGDDCSIGEFCHITAVNKITIGNGLLTGRFVYIGDNAHGGLSWEDADIPPIRRRLTSKGEIKIGRNVWIGDKVTILGGVTIGDNVIIGAGSIVTHDLPSNCMAAGMSAKIIKKLDICQKQEL